MNPSVRAARVLVEVLASMGVAHVVICPGSRSAPLAYALAEAAREGEDRDPNAPALSVHVRIDERSAGYLAVGIARATRAPVAVATTSGGAVANLHPAVLEAHHAGLPLVVLAADRPHELRGIGANQTTNQIGLFNSAVRMTLDLSAPAGGYGELDRLRRAVVEAVVSAKGTYTGDPGPVHLNLAYREPLVPDDSAWTAAEVPELRPTPPLPESTEERRPRGWDRDLPTLVVAGDGAGPVARDVAEHNGWPLLAEPSSRARGGPNAIAAYRLLLGSWADQVHRLVVFGRPTLSRQVQWLLARRDVDSIAVVHRGAAAPEAGRGANRVVTEVPPWLLDGEPTRGGAWLEQWQRGSRWALAAVTRVAGEVDDDVITGPTLAAEVAAAVSPDDVLVVASSNPIRDLDLVADWAEPPTVLANRGLSGIDGTLSTAAGVALALDRPVRALVGDLAFLHDVGGLLVGPLERRPDLQVVVANDDGGSIFAALEYGDPAHAAAFERMFATPHGADLASLCAGYGVEHTLVTDLDELRDVLGATVEGMSVVEVAVDRAGRRDLHAQMARAVVGAVAEIPAAPEPEPAPKPAPDGEESPEPAADADADAEPESEETPEPDADADAEPESEESPEPDAEPDPEPDAEPDPEPDAEPDPEPDPGPLVVPELEPDSEPGPGAAY